MTIELTEENVTETFRQILAEFGDQAVYVRPPDAESNAACLYVHDGATGPRPGCIVGHLLHRLGVSYEALRAREGYTANAILFGNDPDNPLKLLLRLPLSLADRIRAVQIAQDHGKTWGEAVRRGGFEV
jgi:hypothetical protein